jgi:hypothetical protein
MRDKNMRRKKDKRRHCIATEKGKKKTSTYTTAQVLHFFSAFIHTLALFLFS